MIKYSLQNECLENIEAFTDEQMNREMAVIESVLDVFDKACLMMELSNSDVNIPDCSMFMESTFFQEDENNTGGDGDPPTGNNQAQTGGDPATPKENTDQNNTQEANNDSQNKSGNGEKVTNNPEEYNKEHHFRKANKKGNLENIFISILLFIPRLLALPIKLLINFIKNKKKSKNVETVKNATPEQKKAAAEAISKAEGSTTNKTKIENGEIVASATIKGKGSAEDSSGTQVSVAMDKNGDISTSEDIQVLADFIEKLAEPVTAALDKPNALTESSPIITTDIKTVEQQVEERNKAHAEQRQHENLEAFEGKRDQTLQVLQNRLTQMQKCVQTVQNTINQLKQPGALNGYSLQQVVDARNTDLKNIKNIIIFINNAISKINAMDSLTDIVLDQYIAYMNVAKKYANDVSNTADADSAALTQNQNDVKSGTTPTQKFNINPVGGET